MNLLNFISTTSEPCSLSDYDLISFDFKRLIFKEKTKWDHQFTKFWSPKPPPFEELLDQVNQQAASSSSSPLKADSDSSEDF